MPDNPFDRGNIASAHTAAARRIKVAFLRQNTVHRPTPRQKRLLLQPGDPSLFPASERICQETVATNSVITTITGNTTPVFVSCRLPTKFPTSKQGATLSTTVFSKAKKVTRLHAERRAQRDVLNRFQIVICCRRRLSLHSSITRLHPSRDNSSPTPVSDGQRARNRLESPKRPAPGRQSGLPAGHLRRPDLRRGRHRRRAAGPRPPGVNIQLEGQLQHHRFIHHKWRSDVDFAARRGGQIAPTVPVARRLPITPVDAVPKQSGKGIARRHSQHRRRVHQLVVPFRFYITGGRNSPDLSGEFFYWLAGDSATESPQSLRQFAPPAPRTPPSATSLI